MNKAQKEVQQTQLNDEKRVIKLLELVYEQAKKDCEQKIKELSARTDLENLQSIIYQKEYQEALKKQLSGILDDLHTRQFTSIADYLQVCYIDGFSGTMYDLHKQGIPIIIPINQDQVVKAVRTDSKLSSSLYAKLGEDVGYLKRSIRAELSRGIASGSTWNEMALRIAKGMNSPFRKAYNNAIRIARTEGHRIQNEAALDGQHWAKKKGADIVKQWDSTLDGRTRDEHRECDGQIREIDEAFDVGGEKMQAPGVGGSARNVCNCRCCLLQRAKWALDDDELKTLQERAAFFGLDKSKDFEDFKQKYLKLPDNADTMNVNSDVSKDRKPISDFRTPENKDYVRLMHGSQGAVSVDDRIQIHNHEKADGSGGGYVATTNYSTINSNLRNDGYTRNSLDDDDMKTIESLRTAISKYQLDDDFIMTRYVNGDYISSVFGIKTRMRSKGELEDITDSITRISNPYVVKEGIPNITKELQEHIGETITEKAFVSFSVVPNKNIMKSKSVRIDILAKKGTNCYIPVNRKESEGIFADGSGYVLRDVQWDETERKWILTMEIE